MAVAVMLLMACPVPSQGFDGASLSDYGCRPGRSFAGAIEDKSFRLAGPDALGQAGDYIIMNGEAAYVVSGLDRINTYYYYGGIPIDGVALEDCVQTHPEQFEEIGFFMGELDLSALSRSGIRSFKGERVEVISDGSDGGEAVIRVHGTDAPFWIVEFQLMIMAYDDLGIPKKLTGPLGLDYYVDYILAPDSPVLRIELNIVNPTDEKKSVFTAAGGFFGNDTENRYFTDRGIWLGPFTLDAGLPAIVSSSGEGAWAFSMLDANLATMNLSGFDAFFDPSLLRRRIVLRPAGKPGDSAKVVHFFAAGDSDYNSALSKLHNVNPHPLPRRMREMVEVSGTVTDSVSGKPVAGAQVEIEIQNRYMNWKFMDGFVTDNNGRFGGEVPDLGRDYRALAYYEGRPTAGPVKFDPTDTRELAVEMDPGGTLRYEVKDGDATPLPAKISLFQEGPSPVRTIYCANGSGQELVEPGTYDVSITRGYEYIPVETEVTILPDSVTRLDAVLIHAVDTTGYLSADMHIHAGPSGDNKISIPDRIVTVAVEGLEIPVATDHEAVIDWQPAVYETGLQRWVNTVLGEEVTATIPEHINMFPVESDFGEDDRGGPVSWYGKDIGEVYQAIRDRGADIVQLNHPRGYFRMIEYDRESATATLEHPEYMGLPEDADLWSWNFDSIEYMNGNEPVFDSMRQKGMFEYWMSFINNGHTITAVANTDAHNYTAPGDPRTYFPSSTDMPEEFVVGELVSAVKEGRMLISSGAFARVTVNGAGMGDVVESDGNEVEVKVRIESIPRIDVTHFKVFVNCDQALHVDIPPTADVVKYDGTVTVNVPGDSNIVVMGFGKERLPRGLRQFDPLMVPRFTTNPVYVDVGGDGYTPPGWDGCDYKLP